MHDNYTYYSPTLLTRFPPDMEVQHDLDVSRECLQAERMKLTKSQSKPFHSDEHLEYLSSLGARVERWEVITIRMTRILESRKHWRSHPQ